METFPSNLDKAEATQEKIIEKLSNLEVHEDTIIIISESGKKVNLKEHIPRNITFKSGEDFSVSFVDSKGPVVTYNPLESPSSVLLSIFHEVGHSKYKNYHRFFLRPPKLLKAVGQSYKAFVLADKSTKDKAQIELAMMEGRFHKAKGEVEVKVEREAWYYALTVARKIKETYNIDILSEFGGFYSVKEFIDKCLATYEVAAIQDGLEAFEGALKK